MRKTVAVELRKTTWTSPVFSSWSMKSDIHPLR